jgi:hypothetical protein
VELVIKRLKSLLEVDRLRARKNSQLVKLYLHDKPLYAAIVEKIAPRRLKGTLIRLDKPCADRLAFIPHGGRCRQVVAYGWLSCCPTLY